MSQTRIITINGKTFELSSRDPEIGQHHLALAQILLEMAVERGTDLAGSSMDEIVEQWVATGYDPETGEVIG